MEEQPYFPLFVSLKGKRIVVVGGGKIATRRIKTLLEFTDQIIVIAPILEEGLQELHQDRRILLKKREFLEQDVEGAYCVIAATNQETVNQLVYQVCKKKGIIVNHVGDKTKCDFFFPGIVKKEQLVIGVTASGSDHGLVKRVTCFIKECLKG